MQFLITNVKVLDPNASESYEADVLLRGDQIARVDKRWLKPSVVSNDTRILETHGAYLAPAFWDLHVHAREPGQEHKETLATAALAAAHGGVGRFFAMPNTEPAIDNVKTLRWVLDRAKAQEHLADIEFIGAVTKKRAGKTLADLTAMRESGAVAFSDDGNPVSNPKILKRALELTASFDSFVIDHAEIPKLSRGGAMHEGALSRKLKLPGIPSQAEFAAVAQDIEILKKTKGRLHIAHVSTKESVDLIRKAKKNGLSGRLTCEVCPHHFSLTDEVVGKFGSLAKVNPPLREREDVLALLEAIADGTVDAIASDHAPHAKREKDLAMIKAPFGMIGMETMFSLAITHLVRPGVIPLARAIYLLTAGPAKVVGRKSPSIEPGEPANLVLFDPAARTSFRRFVSKSQNSPFLGATLYGKVLATIHRGQVVYNAF